MGQIQPACTWETFDFSKAQVLTDTDNESRRPRQLTTRNPDDSASISKTDHISKVSPPSSNEKNTTNYRHPSNTEDNNKKCSFQGNCSPDTIELSALDLHASKKSKSRKAPSKKKSKRRSWLPWKKRKEAKEFVTTGVTVRLSSNHNIVLFRPQQPSKGYLSLQNERKGRRSFNDEEKLQEAFDSANSRTKLVNQNTTETRRLISMQLKGRKDSFIDSSIVCGKQIFATRYHDPENFNICPRESAPQSMDHSASTGGYTRRSVLLGMNVLKPSIFEEERLQELLLICRERLNIDEYKSHSIRQETSQNDAIQNEAPNHICCSGAAPDMSNILCAVVPPGIGMELFNPERVQSTNIRPVEEMICVDEANEIYVCDIGLSSEQCDFIVDTTERCSRGNYAAYTYAKQTLGCRDHDDLATLCEWPVIRAYSSIMEHLEGNINTSNGLSKRNLVLDEREPHLVKYDTSKKERQKLDMHTDKSEWTIIIALSDGNGIDYNGGGTYIECIDSTVHLQKGHALIFPGKRRHRGQKIVDGIRFLLVGFLVEKEELDAKREKNRMLVSGDLMSPY